MEGRLLSEYLRNRLHDLGLKRKDVPRLLGYQNANKCFRLLDRFLTGSFDLPHLVERIRLSPLGGPVFELTYQSELDLQASALQQQIDAAIAEDEDAFRPHLWCIHEREVPYPLAALNAFGTEYFKRLDLPDCIRDIPYADQRIEIALRYINEYLRDDEIYIRLNSVYGSLLYVLYRDEYRLSFVYDVELAQFIGHTHDVPSRPLFFVHQGKVLFRYRR